MIGILLLLGSLAIFAQVRSFGFVNYDDPDYVIDNEHVNRGLTADGIVWALRQTRTSNWHPVTWMSHMLDCQWFGLDPGAHHVVNAVLHALNATLLFIWLRQMALPTWRSAFVASVFAIHPLRVESVAWVSERKDVLSGMFFFLTAISYVRYSRYERRVWHWAALAFFAFGLLSKPMLVTMPAVLLLLDVWPLRRLRFEAASSMASPSGGRERSAVFLVREKLPFVALALVTSAAAIWAAHRGGAAATIDAVPLGFRIANAIVAYIAYVELLLLPSGLALLYPLSVLPTWRVATALVLLAATTAFAVYQHRRKPYVVVGWLWFLGMLLPVIGLLQVGVQSMADRYTYLPSVGLCFALTWLVADAAAGSRALVRATRVAAVAALGVCAVLTTRQLKYWRNSVVLWERSIAVTEPNATAQYNLGLAYQEAGRPIESIARFREAVRIRPSFYEAETNLGVALAAQGRLAEAFEAYAAAVRINPQHAQAHFNWAVGLALQGSLDEAMAHYVDAVRIDPTYVQARTNLAVALAQVGRVGDAIDQYRSVLETRPDFADARYNFGSVLLREGRVAEAIEQYAESVRLDPADSGFRFALAVALVRDAQRVRATEQLRKALELQPDFGEAQKLLDDLTARR